MSTTVLKDDYVLKYGKLGDIYSQSLAFLLERAVFYVDDKNPGNGAHIEAMLECRGKEEDKALSESYNALRESGTYCVSSERMKNTVQTHLIRHLISFVRISTYLTVRNLDLRL